MMTDDTTGSTTNLADPTVSQNPLSTSQPGPVISLSDFQMNIKRRKSYASASSDDDDTSSDGDMAYRHRSLDSIQDSETATEALTGRQDTRIANKLRLLVVALFVR